MMLKFFIITLICQRYVMGNKLSELDDRMNLDLEEKLNSALSSFETPDKHSNFERENDHDFQNQPMEFSKTFESSLLDAVKKYYYLCLVKKCSTETKSKMMHFLAALSDDEQVLALARTLNKRNFFVDKKKEKNFKDFISMRY